MEYRSLGRTGIKVSEICLGAGYLGHKPPEDASIKLVHTALDLGINFIDTADLYVQGQSEIVLGKALKGIRDQIFVATKFFNPTGPGINNKGLSRLHIMRTVEASLTRLDIDAIDLYQVHHYDPDTPLDETLRALDDLIRNGKVRYIGCSNFAAWQLCKSLWISDRLGIGRFETLQPQYSLINRDIEREIIPFCKEEKVGLIAHSPLGAGFLTGKYKPNASPDTNARIQNSDRLNNLMSHQNLRIIKALKTVAEERCCSMVQVALAWVLRDPTISSAICGVSSSAQLEENVEASGMKLSQDELQIILNAFEEEHTT